MSHPLFQDAALAVCQEVGACGLRKDRAVDRTGCICMVYARAALTGAVRSELGLDPLEPKT